MYEPSEPEPSDNTSSNMLLWPVATEPVNTSNEVNTRARYNRGVTCRDDISKLLLTVILVFLILVWNNESPRQQIRKADQRNDR